MRKLASASAPLTTNNEPSSLSLLEGEIAGLTVTHHHLPEATELLVQPDHQSIRVFFQLDGAAVFMQNGDARKVDGRASIVPDPRLASTIKAAGKSELLEIRWSLCDDELSQLVSSAAAFPIIQIYADCERYREHIKSEKTINRTIVPTHLVPRFCMGSVETVGPDQVDAHAHPILDQMFFGLSENDVTLLIDGERYPMGPSTLFHIPLGSTHGSEVASGKRLHYLWMDFFRDASGMDYIASDHHPIP